MTETRTAFIRTTDGSRKGRSNENGSKDSSDDDAVAFQIETGEGTFT